jgi:ribosomal protection tetracycline resistance protein
MRVVAILRAVPLTQELRGSSFVLEGDIAAARVHDLQEQVPRSTRGEGALECAFDHYEPVDGIVPTRARTDLNPLNRKEYLGHLMRRV